jgi:hypothetical protein
MDRRTEGFLPGGGEKAKRMHCSRRYGDQKRQIICFFA